MGILTEQEKQLAISQVMEQINKKYGKGTIVRGADAVGLNIKRLKTGSIALDVATGGGWAWGKLNEIFGIYCLDGDSVVNYHLPHWEKRNGKDRTRPITIAELYKTNIKNEEIYVESINEFSNEVILNRVINVYKSGVKGICKITTEHGFTLKSTTQHRYLTKNGYEMLRDLQVGESIAVVDKRNSFNKREERKKKEILVRWHPVIEPRKHSLITGPLGGQGIRGGKYVRIYEHRLIYEAAMNNLSMKNYIELLNNYDGRQLVTIPKGYDIHHKDFDYTNNRLENLELLESLEHSKLHANRGQASKKMLWDTITSIEYIEDKMTYDIAMVAPNNNFVANGIVVHNSGGKSYVSMLTMAQTQRDYPDANIALIDFEGAFDADWAKKIGVDVDKLIISPAEYMEDGLQIAIDLIHSGDCALIVVDSLAAACPRAEFDGDITEFTVGLRARLGNKFVRKSKGKVDLTTNELDLGNTTVLVVNQTYKNIGGYGDPDVTPGGEQVKFGAMIRVKIRKGEVINDTKDGTQIMQESRFSVVKNKTYPPHKAGAFWFSTTDNPKGKAGEIYRVGEIITYGVLTGIINRSGAWYSLPEEFGLEGKLQGESAVASWVEENPDKFPRLEELVMNSILKGEINE